MEVEPRPSEATMTPSPNLACSTDWPTRNPPAAAGSGSVSAAPDATVAQARDAIRLGQPFKVYAHDMPEFRIEVAKRFAAYNAQVGARHDAPVPAQVRAAIRTQVGRETFRATFGRDPVDARELAGLIATVSRPQTTAVAGYDLTFSPVKSVSTLWALAEPATAATIERAHLAAIGDALRLDIENWRWSGVPFFIRTGKRLPRRASEIAVQFKDVPPILFNVDQSSPLEPNVLALRIQPDEGLSLRIATKLPGPKVRIYPVKMDFRYGSTFGEQTPEAYERLLLDVMAGDATLFMRRDAVEASWTWVNNLLEGWQQAGTRWLPEYPAGTWGPLEAEKLIQAENRKWRTL